MKMQDINDIWCKATEENYDAFIAEGISYNYEETWNDIVSSGDLVDGDIFVITYGCFELVDGNSRYEYLKEIHLVNGEFQYVEETKSKKEITKVWYKYKTVNFLVKSLLAYSYDCSKKSVVFRYKNNQFDIVKGSLDDFKELEKELDNILKGE